MAGQSSEEVWRFWQADQVTAPVKSGNTGGLVHYAFISLAGPPDRDGHEEGRRAGSGKLPN